MKGFDITREQQESSREYVKDRLALLQRAKEAGWVDPGITETLDETVKRARHYLYGLPQTTGDRQ